MPEAAGPNTINPLLSTTGVSRLRVGAGPGSAAELARGDAGPGKGGGVAVETVDGLDGGRKGGGVRRVTRAAHGRAGQARTYVIEISPATADEVDAVRDAFALTRGGAGSTRWRHPADDLPGTADNVDTAPRYRLVGAVAVNRAPQSNSHSLSLTLEEVDPLEIA